jgi:hypothetical protein
VSAVRFAAVFFRGERFFAGDSATIADSRSSVATTFGGSVIELASSCCLVSSLPLFFVRFRLSAIRVSRPHGPAFILTIIVGHSAVSRRIARARG